MHLVIAVYWMMLVRLDMDMRLNALTHVLPSFKPCPQALNSYVNPGILLKNRLFTWLITIPVAMA